MRRLLRTIALLAAGLVLLASVTFALAWWLARESRGRIAAGPRLERMQRAPSWHDGHFVNRLPRVDGPWTTMAWRALTDNSPRAVPDTPIGTVSHVAADFAEPPPSGLRITWLGHSTVLLDIDGLRVITDPMFSERASPFTFVGPHRFFPPPIALDALPRIDVAVISHDHYDHLDMASVRALAARATRFAVPLGIGARLSGWGVPATQITEFDWWQSLRVGAVTITSVPARHFSGRWVDDQNLDLWTGWAIASPDHRVYYSGDTALHDDMPEIGKRLGPFDVAMIEIGEYDALWSDVHLGPEQAVLASRLVRASLMLPVHWAIFNLALHSWTEPIERARVAAARSHVRMATPRPGESFEPAVSVPSTQWWPTIAWRTVQQAPAYSTHVDELLRQREHE